jgi:hypothetical protein
VLLTTREELGRPVEHLALDKLQPEAALDLLTSLVGVQRIQQESDIAEQLCEWLDYLPLGLELVGRYLERDLICRSRQCCHYWRKSGSDTDRFSKLTRR